MLFKNGQQLSPQKTQAECLQNFITFIEKIEEKCKQKTYKPSVVTVLIGHNASTFDSPLLLRSAPSTFSGRQKSLGVIFADSLVLIKHLRTCSINTAPLSNLPNNKLGTLYAGLFKQQFDAHGALEDVKALSKILFHSSFKVTVQQILEHSGSTTVEGAIRDVQFLD